MRFQNLEYINKNIFYIFLIKKSGKMEKYVNDRLIPNVKEKSSKKYRRILQNNLE